MVTVNVVVLAGTVAADPTEKALPSGDRVTEFRLSVPEAGKRSLPLPVSAWHGKTITKRALGASARATRCSCTASSSGGSTGTERARGR